MYSVHCTGTKVDASEPRTRNLAITSPLHLYAVNHTIFWYLNHCGISLQIVLQMIK